jgi:hypothetical protein
MRNELVSLYELALRHDAIVQRLENGYYARGICSMRIPEKDKLSITLPTQSKFPELFKTLTKERHLKSTNPTLTRAQEVYIKNIKAANLEKSKKLTAAKEEAKLNTTEVNKIDVNGSSLSALMQHCKDINSATLLLVKEETQLLEKIATMESLKTKANGKTLDKMLLERNDLRKELQEIVKVNKEKMSQIERQKRQLEKGQTKFARMPNERE